MDTVLGTKEAIQQLKSRLNSLRSHEPHRSLERRPGAKPGPPGVRRWHASLRIAPVPLGGVVSRTAFRLERRGTAALRVALPQAVCRL